MYTCMVCVIQELDQEKTFIFSSGWFKLCEMDTHSSIVAKCLLSTVCSCGVHCMR